MKTPIAYMYLPVDNLLVAVYNCCIWFSILHNTQTVWHHGKFQTFLARIPETRKLSKNKKIYELKS